MAKKESGKGINLLPQEEFDASVIGRSLNWLTTTFRYIVMGTEMVVLIAFLTRFYFDAKSSDLINSINQKKAIISSYSTFENQFRQTQEKLNIYADYANTQNKVSPTLDGISSLIPSDITLNSISIDSNLVQIMGITPNESSAASFVNSLNSKGILLNAAIISVESKEGSDITFVISGNKKGGAASAK